MPQFNLMDARLKLERAREHILDVERAVENLTAPELYKISIQRDESPYLSVDFETLHDGNQYLSAIIGDAIGNLRSSLDYLMGAVVKPLGGNPAKVTFPFADNEKGFKGEVRAAPLLLTPDLVDVFDKIEAYEGGAGRNLWAINKLRNIDKHRLLITVNHLAGIKASWRAGSSTFTNCGMWVEAGKQGKAIRAPAADFEFTSYPTPMFQIMFDEPKVPPFTEVGPFLHLAASDIDSLLQSLEKV
ncbi:hypothetical protein GGR90_003686 [Sphingopyxis italica]|uniref:Uncharacterized protein n=1 Tax=Sphingopyxis italica TaxID=1129133 RepID=A0A7X6BA43_9SPHN|nr:hypothetical protein [Sphingopyxis italica]NJB91475.1 hypothetical protein [Sphingopyxis italica]